MTIDFWGLGLQAVNVLILVWLLSRVFWRPVASAIAKRQEAARAMVDAAQTSQAEADKALADLTQARTGIEAERQDVLAKATTDAENATKAALAQARSEAEKMTAAARLAIANEADAARKQQAAQAAELSVDIAAKLLHRLNTPDVQAAFLDLLVEAIGQMAPDDRAALAAAQSSIELISTMDLGDEEKAMITKKVNEALGGAPDFTFVTDPDLIAGLEIRTAHFVLHNSWRSDLARILKELKHVA